MAAMGRAHTEQQIWKYRTEFAGMTKVNATGGLELKPKTWELLRASTAGTVEPIGHDECHRVAIYGRVETRLKLLATESEVRRWGGFF